MVFTDTKLIWKSGEINYYIIYLQKIYYYCDNCVFVCPLSRPRWKNVWECLAKGGRLWTRIVSLDKKRYKMDLNKNVFGNAARHYQGYRRETINK